MKTAQFKWNSSRALICGFIFICIPFLFCGCDTEEDNRLMAGALLGGAYPNNAGAQFVGSALVANANSRSQGVANSQPSGGSGTTLTPSPPPTQNINVSPQPPDGVLDQLTGISAHGNSMWTSGIVGTIYIYMDRLVFIGTQAPVGISSDYQTWVFPFDSIQLELPTGFWTAGVMIIKYGNNTYHFALVDGSNVQNVQGLYAKCQSALNSFMEHRTQSSQSVTPQLARQSSSQPANSLSQNEIWRDNCAKCHGLDGTGNTMLGQRLGVRNMAQVQSSLADEQLFSTISLGVKDERGFTMMKPYSGQLSGEEIRTLITSIRNTFGSNSQGKGTTSQTSPSNAVRSGIVNVSADDATFEVYSDGAFVGNAPAKLKLSEGSHVIEVKKAGFKDYKKEIKVMDGSDLNLKAVLEKE